MGGGGGGGVEQRLSGEKNGSDLGMHNSGPFLFISGIAALLLPAE